MPPKRASKRRRGSVTEAAPADDAGATARAPKRRRSSTPARAADTAADDGPRRSTRSQTSSAVVGASEERPRRSSRTPDAATRASAERPRHSSRTPQRSDTATRASDERPRRSSRTPQRSDTATRASEERPRRNSRSSGSAKQADQAAADSAAPAAATAEPGAAEAVVANGGQGDATVHDANEDSAGDEDVVNASLATVAADPPPESCPYLDTIRRIVLDFDMERRARTSPAYRHSFDADHHVFLNLETLRFYCLPDNYEVQDPSLDDIKHQVRPVYTPGVLSAIDSEKLPHRSLDRRDYFPGIVGVNNVKANDYVNVVALALAHVQPIRDFFLLTDLSKYSELVQKFGQFVGKVWNPRLFRPHCSPHELLSAVTTASKGKFRRDVQSDAHSFMSWLLNTLHRDLGGTRTPGSSVIHTTFQGHVRVATRTLVQTDDADASQQQKQQPPPPQTGAGGEDKEPRGVKERTMPFLMLTLDLPPTRVYKDDASEIVIAAVPIFDLLRKFDGVTEADDALRGETRRYRLQSLPPYLVLHVRRFMKNQFYVEKNGTIVPFPVVSLDMSPYVDEAWLTGAPGRTGRYDLVANIVHDGKAVAGGQSDGRYHVHVQHAVTRRWYTCDDLRIDEIPAQMLAVTEAFLLVFQQQ